MKILPIGAPEKYASVAPPTLAMPPVVEGKLPLASNTAACWSGAVSQAISSAACCLCGLEAGIPR